MKQEVKITVYGASSDRMSERFMAQSARLGELIARHGWRAVNGGGAHGVMGGVTAGALDAGGAVTGVIPMFMVEKGWLNERLSDVVIAADMPQRKQLLIEDATAVVVMPGGIGTFDELFEAITLRQLRVVDCAVILVNIDGFYDPIIEMLNRASAEHLMRGNSMDELFTVVPDADAAIEAIERLA